MAGLVRTNAPFGSILLGSATQSPRRLRIRVQLLLSALLISTHLIGAVAVIAITVLVLPVRGLTEASVLVISVSAPVYVGVSALVGGLVATKAGLAATRWFQEGRPPTPRERRGTLRLPMRLTVIQAGAWFGAALLFGIESLVVQPDLVLGTVSAVVITGLVVCGIAYLFGEFALRPVAAQALSAGRVERLGLIGVLGRMLLFWALGTAAPVTGLLVTALVALTEGSMSRQRLALITLVLTTVVLVFGSLVTVLTARSVVAPLGTVRHALDRVRAGDLDAEVAVFDGTELGLLQAGFNDMAHGLREREKLRDMFGRHVGREVAAAAAAGEVVLGGESRVVSVLFIDLIGSTGYTVDRDPHEVVATLNAFFAVVVDEVDAHRGLVNKFMGDAALVIFGAPVDLPGHATAALSAARRIGVRLAEEVPQIQAGIGVATGTAVAGNLGERSRYEYTVIGDSVNSAARLCELAKEEPGRVLVAEESVQAADPAERAFWEPAGSQLLRGRGEPTRTARLAPDGRRG